MSDYDEYEKLYERDIRTEKYSAKNQCMKDPNRMMQHGQREQIAYEQK